MFLVRERFSQFLDELRFFYFLVARTLIISQVLWQTRVLSHSRVRFMSQRHCSVSSQGRQRCDRVGLEGLVHVLELLDGHVDRQVEGVEGQPLDGPERVVET